MYEIGGITTHRRIISNTVMCLYGSRKVYPETKQQQTVEQS